MTMRLEDTELYQSLSDRCHGMRCGLLDGPALLGMTSSATQIFADLLNRSCMLFGNYTLHDENHAIRVVHLMSKLMGAQTSSRLNVVDLALLILAAYSHDIGMVIEGETREQIESGYEYRDHLVQNESLWIKAEEAKEGGDFDEYKRLKDALFQDFVRLNHHHFSAEMILGRFSDRLKIRGSSLASPVAELARSHGEPVSALERLRVFPFAGEYRSDLKFLACVLRLSDILDLDPARAPGDLLNFIDSLDEDSMNQWRKHQASFAISESRIEFHGRFTNYFHEKALRDTLNEIERERQGCMSLCGNQTTRALVLKLKAPVQAEIHSDGYVFEEFRFRLEHEQIMSLLMGTQLYRDERAFIRELLQNALDACRHVIAAGADPRKIGITVRHGASEQGEFVEVSDTGAGMTREIVRDYFMRVGRSYYKSMEFRQRQLRMDAVGEFGIGILSCFMRSDYIEVETRPHPMAHAEGSAESRDGLLLEIRGANQYFVVRKKQIEFPGTTVRVFLKTPLDESIESIVSHFLGRVPVEVTVSDPRNPESEFRNIPFDFSPSVFNNAFVEVPGVVRYETRELIFGGGFGFDLFGRFRFYLFRAGDNVRLRWSEIKGYSDVQFNEFGVASAQAREFSVAVWEPARDRLNRIRELLPRFRVETSSELAHIVKGLDGFLDHLQLGKLIADQAEVHWQSLSAQVAVLSTTMSFRSHPLCVTVEKEFNYLLRELQLGLEGNVQLGVPVGVLTQDGINLTNIVDLPRYLRLGIGFVYNLDFCGPQKFSLSPARDSIVFDATSNVVINALHRKIGEFLGCWFKELAIPENEVHEFAAETPELLGKCVLDGFK